MRVDTIPEIGRLSTAEKILLVEDLWDSISADAAPLPVPQSHLDELDRRWARFAAAPGDLLSLDELRATVDASR
jgi:putative addiction module component (TIGR02574 family)